MKKNNNELKAITITKRTCSDINQLFSELSEEISEEYLHTDDPAVTENIKKALSEFNSFHDMFLDVSKKAVNMLNNAVSVEEIEEAKKQADDAKKRYEESIKEKEDKAILPL